MELPADTEEGLLEEVQGLVEAGMSLDEIRKALADFGKAQAGVRTTDWRQARNRSRRDGRLSETWPIPTGVKDDDGFDVLLDVEVREPENLKAILTAYAQTQSMSRDMQKRALENLIVSCLVEPSELRVFSNHLDEDGLEKYQNDEYEEFPADAVDAFWDMNPVFRITLEQRLLDWLGFNRDFFESLTRMAIGKDERHKLSSMMSQENLDKILSNFDESSKKGTGKEETSTTPGSKPSGDETSDESTGSKTTTSSSETSSPEPSKEAKPSSSNTRVKGGSPGNRPGEKTSGGTSE